MIQFLFKFLHVLKGKNKTLLAMVFLFIFVSLLEAIGTGVIGPFMAVATDPEAIASNAWLNSVYAKLNLGSQNQFLLLLGALIIFIFYVKAFLSFQAQKFIFDFGFRQQGELSVKLMRLYLAAPYTFHLGRNSAVLIQNIINETSNFVNGLMIPLLVSISNAVVILALIVLLIVTNVMATLIISGLLLIAFVLFHRFKDRLAYWGKESSESRSEMIRLINHGLGGLKETRIIGCESFFEEKLQKQAQRFGHSVSLGLSFSNLPRYLIEAFLITFLILFTFLFLVIHRDNSQNLSSVLGIFALASIRLLPATGNLLSSINGMRYHLISLDKLYLEFKELEQTEDIKIGRAAINQDCLNQKVIAFTKQVVLDNVFYRYPNASKNSLEGVDLKLKKGQSIGLIGKSGAGKTTLVDVILGLLIPQNGDIKVDGISIYNDLRAWQNTIGYVPQSIFLTDDTLERNIAFGVSDELIDREKLHKAIAAAQLTELIEQLPDGLHTMVGERGVLLSGGQRQRVGIARALYHEREILVFDEATAALDNETEELVTEAIKALSGIKTMIIIAHRLSTIEHCDCIYMMQNGQVVKSGSYQEVVLSR
jgi:ABC-type multidrug transport system fused ATPase/permease subunit